MDSRAKLILELAQKKYNETLDAENEHNRRETYFPAFVDTQLPSLSAEGNTILLPRNKAVSHFIGDHQEGRVQILDLDEFSDFEESPSEYDPTNDADDSSSETIPSPPRKNITTKLQLTQAHGPHTRNETGKIRNKKSDPSSWEKNERKILRNKGQEYTAVSRKVVAQRKMKDVPCKCRAKCTEKFTDYERQEIFDSYWGSGNYERQRDFLCQNVNKIPVKQRRPNKPGINEEGSRRQMTYEYKLNGIKVCKKFFMGTLDIGEKTVIIAKKKETSGFVIADQRGRHLPANKTNDNAAAGVREHINLFPRVQSHYCRSSCTKEFLAADLNIRKMYRLYTVWCAEKQTTPVKENVYRRIFTTDFNLYFHRPKKDICRICEKQSNMTEEEKAAFEDEYQRHIKNKNDAREQKENDKQKAKVSNHFKSFTFDLQSVLYTPCSQVSSLYYTRKFCTYNLTIYDQATKQGTCYLWTEADGKRGSDEIGTCLKKHLESLPANITHVSLFSDSCGGQNRNRFIASLLLYLVRTSQLEIIEHKFLETGNTDMEVDSMHSAIERAKKNIPVYTPTEWATIIKSACIKTPYVVEVLSYEDFLDLKHLRQCVTISHLSTTSVGEPISWMDIKAIQVCKENTGIIKVKRNHADAEFLILPAEVTKKRGRPQKCDSLQLKYKAPLGISMPKLKDLLKLCTDGVIPRAYHDFYIKLKGTCRADTLPEPDVEDDSECEK